MPKAVLLHALCLRGEQAALEIRARLDAEEAVLVLNPAAPELERDALVRRAAPSFLIDASGRHAHFGARLLEAGAAVVAVSSGTTGVPKLVEHTRRSITASAESVSRALSVTPDDVWFCCLPLHFVAGLAIVVRSWWSGAGLVVAEHFSIEEVFEAPRRVGATLVSLVPTMLARMLDAGRAPVHYRHVLLGGGPIPVALFERALAAGVNLSSTYGMTETFGGVMHDGFPLAGVEASLSTTGEIRLRGPTVMRSYLDDEEASAAVLTKDGWLSTGDLGAIGPGGKLAVLGRLDDLINTGGVKVSPTELEAVLSEHPLVDDVCVVGQADEDLGEAVVCYVVASERPPELQELRDFAAKRLSREKLPRRLVLIGEVPRSPGGKILRRLLPRELS